MERESPNLDLWRRTRRLKVLRHGASRVRPEPEPRFLRRPPLER